MRTVTEEFLLVLLPHNDQGARTCLRIAGCVISLRPTGASSLPPVLLDHVKGRFQTTVNQSVGQPIVLPVVQFNDPKRRGR